MAQPAAAGNAPAPNARRYLAVRIGFGLIWAIDATLKWLPGFRHGFLGMVQGAAQGQPAWLAPWFHFWTSAIAPAPGLFAVLTALAETAVCLSLLLAVPRGTRAAAASVDSRLVRRWPALAPLTFRSAR